MSEPTTAAAAHAENVMLPNVESDQPSREVFEHRRWLDRAGGSVGLLVGSVLLLGSMFTAWWTMTISDGGSTETVSFLPGWSFSTTGIQGAGGLFSGTTTYSASNLTQLGLLYGNLLWAEIIVTLVAVAAAFLGFASLRAIRSRVARALSLVTAISATAVSIMLPLLMTGFQPNAFNMDVGGSTTCTAPPSPCSAFWGSQTLNGTTLTWGPGLGWGLSVAAAVVMIASLAFLVSSLRTYPYGDEA